MTVAVMTPFQRSRIYAQGWNAARQAALKSGDDLKAARAANPHAGAAEHASWDEGFAGGVK